MDSLSWINSLPENPSPERDKFILSAIENNLVVYNWIPIVSNIDNYQAIFQVCDDAIRVETEDNLRFRFPVSAKLAQQCADLIDASFITSKISDLSYQQATIVVDATILQPTSDMATTTKSKKWNKLVESKRNGKIGLFRDCGKSWILNNRLKNSAGAVNYGFYDKTAPYTSMGNCKLWQNAGTKHNALHTDYSQTLILMKSVCEINGESITVTEVMKDKQLSQLLNYEGVLNFVRQPEHKL